MALTPEYVSAYIDHHYAEKDKRERRKEAIKKYLPDVPPEYAEQLPESDNPVELAVAADRIRARHKIDMEEKADEEAEDTVTGTTAIPVPVDSSKMSASEKIAYQLEEEAKAKGNNFYDTQSNGFNVPRDYSIVPMNAAEKIAFSLEQEAKAKRR